MTPTLSSPTPEIEAFILDLWRKVLNRPELTVEDDFFDSGGDSLLATDMLLQLNHLAPEAVPIEALLETGTVRSFTAYLQGMGG